MYKNELINEVVVRTGMPYGAAEKAVNAVFDVIRIELTGGGSVAVPGFGVFSVKERAARKGRNPQTGEEIDIPAGNVPVFKPGKSLKDLVRCSGRGDSTFKKVTHRTENTPEV